MDDWIVKAFVMRDKQAFESAGLIDPRVPDFKDGFALGNSVWVVAQESPYYTRHLLLHEGAHALAFDQFGGAGPFWFMEGTAELLACHHGSGDSTEINKVPKDREQSAHWGRLKLISQRRESNEIPTLETVMAYPTNLTGDPEIYGWCWAASMLLSKYDGTRHVFIDAARLGRDATTDFTRQLYGRLRGDWPVIVARWRLMTHDLDYGFDWEKERVDLSMKHPVWDGEAIKLHVDASRGWQSAKIAIRAGTKIVIAANGRCQIAKRETVWASEPQGVTIEYVRGRPLGQLIGCLVPAVHPRKATLQPLEVFAIAAEKRIEAKQNSWLVLQVNDSVSQRTDNTGGYEVVVSP